MTEDGNGGPPGVCKTSLEARIVGNRLWELADRLEAEGEKHASSECRQMAERFHRRSDELDRRRRAARRSDDRQGKPQSMGGICRGP